ncbi:hypothetical protein [Methylosinus sp. C49]|uniref:hypothetical protein n=1 Tax=Methylosinus sp. C49 TaxID=2699395 RepID=UPI00137AC384|nr:hypothetical protein [Methylosinus sp. C49]
MARRHILYIERGKLPDRAAHQKAIDATKIGVALDHDYAPFAVEGYLPCTYDGEDAGFDIRFSERDAAAALSPELAAAIGGRDAQIAVKWSSDPREKIAALAFSAALAKDFDAIAHDPEKDKIIAADALLKQAKAAQDEL